MPLTLANYFINMNNIVQGIESANEYIVYRAVDE